MPCLGVLLVYWGRFDLKYLYKTIINIWPNSIILTMFNIQSCKKVLVYINILNLCVLIYLSPYGFKYKQLFSYWSFNTIFHLLLIVYK